MNDRRDASRAAGGVSARATASLIERVPARFEVSRHVIDFAQVPWSEVTYRYPSRPPARVALAGLPDAMREELVWWLWSLHAGGERVNSWTLAAWVKVAAALATDPGHTVDSFADRSVSDWIAAARRQFHERHGRLPARMFEHNHRATIARLCAALERAYGEAVWWRSDVWDARRDPRIPVREHEPLGNARLRFAAIPQPWLRVAIKWFFAAGLERGLLAWSTLPGYRTYLGTHFAEFLAAAGIDTPTLLSDVDADAGLRPVALAFLADLRARGSRSGTPLSLTSVGLSQTAVASFYRFMADHRQEAAKALGEPRWAQLTDAHARLWRAGDQVRRDRRSGGEDYIDPATITRIVSHLDVLAMAPEQAKTVLVDGQPRAIAGRGDPQAMRAFLLAVLTGRRINEILLMGPEPLSPLPSLAAGGERDGEAFVARLRYRQSKIAGAPDTILVEREVVNIISEQQDWLRDHLAAHADQAPPRYLFVAWQSNRLGAQPYSANTLRGLLRGLADELEIRDAHGRPVDFQRTHRMRHTRATELLNGGVPIHVVQRYLGHLSPEMTMRYAATLPETHEREFLRFHKLGADGRDIGLDPADVYEMVQLSRHIDRILPNGVCLLPPLKRCERGNACLTCDHFATDARHLPELAAQLSQTEALIERRRAAHLERTGQEMSDGNVWLEQRLAERRSLQRIVAALQATDDGRAVRGAGTAGRATQPPASDANGEANGAAG